MTKPSSLERKFAMFWSACGGQSLVRELQFHPKRKWRFDFAHPTSMTAFELHGGIWTFGRHGRGGGLSGDCEKSMEAAIMGWLVVPLTLDQITVPNIERLIKLTVLRMTL